MIDIINSGATISECGKYRYELWRIWNEDLPKLMFVMLNPSTADANENDATIRRCIRFAIDWGFGGIYVGNLFAYRATNPKELRTAFNPKGSDNLEALKRMCGLCDKVVYAWGDNVPAHIYCNSLSAINKTEYYHLGLNKSGNPKHPLYLPLTTQIIKVEPLKRYV